MLFVTNLIWNSFTSQNSTSHTQFRQCFVTSRSDLESRNIFSDLSIVSLTFLQLNGWLKCSLCRKNWFFSLLPAIFFELPITRTFFDFPWRFGSRLYWRLLTALQPPYTHRNSLRPHQMHSHYKRLFLSHLLHKYPSSHSDLHLTTHAGKSFSFLDVKVSLNDGIWKTVL